MMPFSLTKCLTNLLHATSGTQPMINKSSVKLLEMIINVESKPFSTKQDCTCFLRLVLVEGAIKQTERSSSKCCGQVRTNIELSTTSSSLESLSSTLLECVRSTMDSLQNAGLPYNERWQSIFKRATGFGASHQTPSWIENNRRYYADKETLSRAYMLAMFISWLHELKNPQYQPVWDSVQHDLHCTGFFNSYVGKDNHIIHYMAAYMHVLTLALMFTRTLNKNLTYSVLAFLFGTDHPDLRLSNGGAPSGKMKEVKDFVAEETEVNVKRRRLNNTRPFQEWVGPYCDQDLSALLDELCDD